MCRPAAQHDVRLHMRESQFGFSYTWEDMQPVRPLIATVLVLQLLGGLSEMVASVYPSWFANLWGGGALATLPGYLLGLLIQRQVNAQRIREHIVMVRRMGLIALALTGSVFVFPLDKF